MQLFQVRDKSGPLGMITFSDKMEAKAFRDEQEGPREEDAPRHFFVTRGPDHRHAHAHR